MSQPALSPRGGSDGRAGALDLEERVAPDPSGQPGWGERNAGLGRALLILVVAGVAASAVGGYLGTVAVVVAIVAMIMLHELGHMVMAKRAGMKVTEYFLGFGPRVWSMRRGETEYGIKPLWVGGYVKIIGMTNVEQVDPEDEPRTYRQQSFPRKLSVAVAGSAMHFLIALVLLWSLLSFVGQPDFSVVRVGGFSKFATGAGPAQQAGVMVGDRIVSIDGKRVSSFDDVANTIHSSVGKPLTLVVERGGHLVSLQVTPVDQRTHPVQGAPAPTAKSGPAGVIGITAASPPLVTVNPVAAVGHSVTGVASLSWQTILALGHVFSPHGISSYVSQVGGNASSTPSPGTPRFYSPVGIVRLANQAVHSGIVNVLNILILINVFVGIFNMLPVLPLDGGHVAIAVYERIRSRKGRRYHADVMKLLPATYAVVLILVFLGVTALYLDITHPLANPFQ